MKFSLGLGLSTPAGSFAETSGKDAGYATMGFAVLLDAKSDQGKYLSWMSTLDLSINQFDESTLSGKLGDVTVSAGSYVILWFMTGPEFHIPISPTENFYVFGQGGMVFSNYPNLKITYRYFTMNQSTDLGIAPGFSVGAGVNLTRVNLAIRYIAAKPEYTLSNGTTYISGASKITIPNTLWEFTVGYNF